MTRGIAAVKCSPYDFPNGPKMSAKKRFFGGGFAGAEGGAGGGGRDPAAAGGAGSSPGAGSGGSDGGSDGSGRAGFARLASTSRGTKSSRFAIEGKAVMWSFYRRRT